MSHGHNNNRLAAGFARQTTPTKAPAANIIRSKPGKLEPISEHEIRLRAYRNWESAGRPNCDGVQFWLAAQHELEEARAATTLEP